MMYLVAKIAIIIVFSLSLTLTAAAAGDIKRNNFIDDEVLKTGAEVRWCMPAGDGTFLVGVRFRRRLAYRDLSDFVG